MDIQVVECPDCHATTEVDQDGERFPARYWKDACPVIQRALIDNIPLPGLDCSAMRNAIEAAVRKLRG
jgi:hypothetical protein